MLFRIIGIVFGLIVFISLYGNYEGEELEEWKKRWERIMGEKYYD
jgi:hypothetical protein